MIMLYIGENISSPLKLSIALIFYSASLKFVSFSIHLKDHLQYFVVGWVLVNGRGQLSGLLLNVLNGHFNGSQHPLQRKTSNIINHS